MFNRILVPLDGSPAAAAALPAARTIACAVDASIELVRVIEPSRDAEESREMLAAAQHNVWAVSDELVRGGVRVSTDVRSGEPGDAIVEAAKSAGADLIVMATHGRSGLQRAIVGSVTQRVLGKSPVPVVVLKPGGKRMTGLSRMLVALDGTAGGALALAAAVGLARAARAHIELLQVVPPLPMWMYGGGEGFAPAAFIDPEWEEAALASALTYVNSIATRLRGSGLNVAAQSVKGPVADAIERVADELDVDLIVMSTHALTGPARAVLGSVADEVVRTSNRPVLLMRRPGGVIDASLPAEAALTV